MNMIDSIIESEIRRRAATLQLVFRKPGTGIEYHFIEDRDTAIRALQELRAIYPPGLHTAFIDSIITAWKSIPEDKLRAKQCDLRAIEEQCGMNPTWRQTPHSKLSVADLQAKRDVLNATWTVLSQQNWNPQFIEAVSNMYDELLLDIESVISTRNGGRA
jgi:hypothetical protein